MKNLFVLVMILSLASCSINGNKHDETETVAFIEEPSESESLDTFEKELNDEAIGGEGIVFEDGGMTFDIESLENSAKEVEKKLNAIKARNDYESEDLKKNAIESMTLNLKMFQGVFCCVTHNGEHCADSKQLRPLKTKYGCERFIKKQ